MTFLGQTPRPGSLLKEKLEKRKRNKTPAEKRPGKHPEYLEKIRQLPCCVASEKCEGPVEAHHLKAMVKRGMGMKSDDRWAVPLCHYHHHQGVERAGSKNEISWFQKRGVDALTLANALWKSRHDLEAMKAVLQAHRATGEPV